VLDTSVLLADPAAFLRFAEHEVILPLVVISELEGKRNHPELGYFARRCLRLLDELRVANGRLDQPVPVNEAGGTLRVELNHADPAVLPLGFRNDSNDSRILSVARALAAEGKDVILISKDMPVRLVRGDREAFGLHGRSAEQRVALDLLLDDSIGIVSLGGRAGTGKSALALCAGLEQTMERRKHKKVIVFRPLYAVGGQDLGYLPGSESEKMSPWAQAVFDTLGALVHDNVREEILARGMLEVLP